MSTLHHAVTEQPRPTSDRGRRSPRWTRCASYGEPIVMVTAYDFPSAQVAEEAGVDIVLVGDSAAMTVLGYTRPTPVAMDEMLMLAKAVRRGLKTPLMVGDMPFGCYEARTSRRSPTPSGSSRRPAARRSSSSAAAPRSSGRGRSSAPASR